MLKLMCAAAHPLLLQKRNLVRSSTAPLQQAVGEAIPYTNALQKGFFFLLVTCSALSFVIRITDQLCVALHQLTQGWGLQPAGQG